MKTWLGLGLILVLAVTIIGCNDDSQSIACTDNIVPSFRISVVDSISGDPVNSPLVWVRDGDFVDTLEVYGEGAYAFWERAGFYDVTAEKEGYNPWAQTGVEVVDLGCHVRTVELTALLQQGL